MTATVYTPLLASLNKRQYPVTQAQLNSLVATTGVITPSSLTAALAPYLLISSLPASLAPYVTTSTLAATLATFPTLSGTNVWTGAEQFKTLPWADITAYGAAGGNSAAVNTAAIQAAIDYVYSSDFGGIVFVPQGNYQISSIGVTLKGGTILMGASRQASFLNGSSRDAPAVTCDGTCADALIRDILIAGYQNTAATTDAVIVSANTNVHMSNIEIVGGKYALRTAGVDSRVYNVYAAGSAPTGGCVHSTGANFYTDCKFDSQATLLYGFFQDAGFTVGSMENQIINTDFSGAFTHSVHVDDGATNQAQTKMIGCIMSTPVGVVSHKWTAMIGCEIGANFSLTATNPVTIVGCYAGSTVTGASGANVIKSANFNI